MSVRGTLEFGVGAALSHTGRVKGMAETLPLHS